MAEKILQWVNIVCLKDDKVLLLNRQHDNFKGWIQPGGKIEDGETVFTAAARELKEETGLTALNLQLKGISGFINPTKKECYVYYDFLCQDFTGDLLAHSCEGDPKWWAISELAKLDMQDDIRERLPLYWREGSFERIHYWDEEHGCIKKTVTKCYD